MARRDLEGALTLFRRCEEQRPGFRDVGERLRTLQERLSQARRHYEDGVTAESQCDLPAAREHFRQCLAIASPFADAQNRIADVMKSITALRQAKRLEEQRRFVAALHRYRGVVERHPCHAVAKARVAIIDTLCQELGRDYQRLIKAQESGRLRQALAIGTSIEHRCSDFEDLPKRLPALATAADYADGLAFEKQRRYRRAIKCYKRCLERDDDYRDAASRIGHCRDMIADRDRGDEDRLTGR